MTVGCSEEEGVKKGKRRYLLSALHFLSLGRGCDLSYGIKGNIGKPDISWPLFLSEYARLANAPASQ